MHPPEIGALLDLAESYVLLNRSGKTQRDLLRGRTLINLFFEDSTRTRTSFELAGKRLGADVINMSVANSSVNKGETLLDTAATLNAMHCDLLVVRHAQRFGVRFASHPLIDENCTYHKPHDAPYYGVDVLALSGLVSVMLGTEP